MTIPKKGPPVAVIAGAVGVVGDRYASGLACIAVRRLVGVATAQPTAVGHGVCRRAPVVRLRLLRRRLRPPRHAAGHATPSASDCGRAAPRLRATAAVAAARRTPPKRPAAARPSGKPPSKPHRAAAPTARRRKWDPGF